MERADFVLQIFFKEVRFSKEVTDKNPSVVLSNQCGINFKLFDLSTIPLEPHFSPNKFEPTGKKITLKIPSCEILFECPLSVFLGNILPDRTFQILGKTRISLQENFENSLQNPGRIVQKSFSNIQIHHHRIPLATISFEISISYTSSTQESIENPIILPEYHSESDSTTKATQIIKKDISTNTRVPLAPDIPETRTRTIFYFDKEDLMKENKDLSEDIQALTLKVQELRNIIEIYESEKRSKAKPIKKKTKASESARSGLIYHPVISFRECN